jgi:cellulose synthase/poly-beta-1,6-N-acetylglucosamine synthase-like glycosyltransferase
MDQIFPALSLVLAIPVVISLVDFIIITRSKFVTQHKASFETKELDDFTILVPIFGDIAYLKNIDYLKQYSSHVVLCTTTKESDEFNSQLNLIAQHFGFKIFRSEVPIASSKFNPNPWKLFTSTLTPNLQFSTSIARDEIMRDSFAVVKTKYCLFLDGDTYSEDRLEKLVGLMVEKDFDVASLRVLVSKTDTLIEKLQSVEYELSMDARRVYPWLTSGAATLAKTIFIKEIMKHHSLYFQGGDIEIGRLALILGYKMGHLSFTFYTEVPSTFKAWWKQRQAWFGGGFRHAVINIHVHNFRQPLFFFYNTVLVFLAFPLRWYEAITHPLVLPMVTLIYWFLIFTFHWKKKKWFYFYFPLYALVQIMVLVPIGVFTYFRMAFQSENIGLIKIKKDSDKQIELKIKARAITNSDHALWDKRAQKSFFVGTV